MFLTRIGLTLTACLLLLACLGCAKAPVTGRTQLNMVSRSEELAIGKQGAQELYRATRTCRDSAKAAAVRRVGRAIAAQADMPDAAWAFNCIEDPQINALCLPGGIIFVNTGLLRHVENDDQLAGVIGHEVGHALARHGAEKLSRARLTAVTVTILAVGAGAAVRNPEVMGDMAQALNASAAVVYLLPGDREQEYEADRMGLLLMAKAGYDPEQFPVFWQKLIDKGLIDNRSDILKTHPADAKRVAAMREAIPEALRLAGRDEPRPAQADADAPGPPMR